MDGDSKKTPKDNLSALFKQIDVGPGQSDDVSHLRQEVFAAIDGVRTLTTVLELFTWQAAVAVSTVWDAVQSDPYWDQENKLIDYHTQPRTAPDDDLPAPPMAGDAFLDLI